jgi:hypothetical protein
MPSAMRANPGKAPKGHAYALRLAANKKHARDIKRSEEDGPHDDFKPRRHDDRSLRHDYFLPSSELILMLESLGCNVALATRKV